MNNTTVSWKCKEDAAQYVSEILENIHLHPAWTITIGPGPSEAYYVVTVITGSLDDIQIQI